MSANLTMPGELEPPAAEQSGDAGAAPGRGGRVTRAALVAAQLLVLVAYAMGLGFLIKTTAGTLVLFSLIAPLLVGLAVATLAGVAIYEFRKRHGVPVFRVYDTGQIIFRQGESGDCAYFIQSGEVEMIRQENGLENVIAKLSEGEYFGEKALISSAPRNVTTRAVMPTRVGIIRKRSFFAMIIVMPARMDQMTGGKRMSKRRKQGF